MKPNCDCLTIIKPQIREYKNLKENDSIMFRDFNLLNGGLVSYVDIGRRTITKAGKERIVKESIPVMHGYCIICGKKYVEA